ncbi:MAG: alpha/beta hydrolase [Aliidiomarina sp.]|uniref:alpha/beta hydrolase n=1 Tax=Aliidiomarina sp. TaxID=1872439 RepID=UPI0025B9BD9E|nr:alpha/beta hydrolase [Aliidiomarina sp.]MCH8500824.1 alpha/beta hydrolase [Aliidiomarina sp.]
MNFYLVALLLGALVVMTGCQPTRVLNAVTPSGAYTLERDVAYGESSRQRFDIYHPTDKQHSAVVVFVYGGAWEEGDKKDFEFIGQAFTRLGYTTLIPDYRVFPEVEFPDFIDDVAVAMTTFSSRYDSAVDLILVGHSAGAHSAAMLATDNRYLGNLQEQIIALIGLSGPYDLPLEHERVGEKFSRVEGNEANPIELASASHPPTLLLHGQADTVAKPAHSERYAERLQELGVAVETHFYPRIRHVDMVASLASPLRFWSSAYSDIESYLARLEAQRQRASEQSE